MSLKEEIAHLWVDDEDIDAVIKACLDAWAWSVLCKEDKDQLNRIEELLNRLLEKPQSEVRD